MGFIENTIAALSPSWALKRKMKREQAKMFADSSTDNGSYYGPYSGAINTRVSSPWFISPTNLEFRYISAVGLRNMRNRARTLERNNELAAGMLERSVENVIGPKGFQIQSTANNPAWTPEKNEAWNKQAEKLFNAWTDTADISGATWIEHQKMVFRSYLRDGDVGVILDKDGYLQGVESDLIDDPDAKVKASLDATIHFGIEVDNYLRPVGYWVKTLPTDDDDGGGEFSNTVRIDEPDFICVGNIKRFGQLRGETHFATIFDLIDQISQWKQATLMAARVAACFGVAITKKNKAGVLANTAGNVNAAGQLQPSVNIEPGMIQYLDQGDEIQTINPAQPGHNFPQNLTVLVRLAGIPFGLPLELVLLDFSKTSYGSCRAAMLQAYRKFQSHQQFFIKRYLKRVYQWRIGKFIKAGLLEANPDSWNHRWIAQPWPFLDPVKELQAIQMALDVGTTTLTDELQGQGISLDDHIAKRANELEKLTANGIPTLHSQALLQFVQPGAAPATPAPKANGSDEDEQETGLEEPDDTPPVDDNEVLNDAA